MSGLEVGAISLGLSALGTAAKGGKGLLKHTPRQQVKLGSRELHRAIFRLYRDRQIIPQDEKIALTAAYDDQLEEFRVLDPMTRFPQNMSPTVIARAHRFRRESKSVAERVNASSDAARRKLVLEDPISRPVFSPEAIQILQAMLAVVSKDTTPDAQLLESIAKLRTAITEEEDEDHEVSVEVTAMEMTIDSYMTAPESHTRT